MSFCWPICNAVAQVVPVLANNGIDPLAEQPPLPCAHVGRVLSDNVNITPRTREMLKRSNRNFLNFCREVEATMFLTATSLVGDEPEVSFIFLSSSPGGYGNWGARR